MLKEVVINDKVLDVIHQGEMPKGNINNKDNMEDLPKNMVAVAYKLIKHQDSSVAKIVTTKDKDSRAHPQI